jgi:hypothetical protein
MKSYFFYSLSYKEMKKHNFLFQRGEPRAVQGVGVWGWWGEGMGEEGREQQGGRVCSGANRLSGRVCMGEWGMGSMGACGDKLGRGEGGGVVATAAPCHPQVSEPELLPATS